MNVKNCDIVRHNLCPKQKKIFFQIHTSMSYHDILLFINT